MVVTMSGDIKKLIDLLRQHDWTYQYADDPSAWRKGNKSSKAIQKEARKLGSYGAYIVEQASIEQKTGNLIWWLAELEERIDADSETPPQSAETQ